MEATAVKTLIDMILKPENLAIMAACWAVLQTIRRVAPELSCARWWARLLPIIPLIICNAALWLPGAAQADMGAGDKLVLGTILGFGAAHGHKLLGQTFLGRDDRITPKPDKLDPV